VDDIPILFDADGPIGCGPRNEPEFPDVQALLAHMDRLGISRALAWSIEARNYHAPTGNRRLLEELDAADPKQRLTPSFVVSPSMLYERGAADELAGLMAERGVRGLRVFPNGSNNRLHHIEPLLERVLDLNPVVFVDVRGVSDDREIIALAKTFPHMPIVVMYAMWPQIHFSVLNLLRRRDNILMDISWAHSNSTIELVVEDFGAERAVFATGLKAHNGAAIGALLYAEVEESVRTGIAHTNLERLLGLGPTPPPAAAPGTETLWGRFLRRQQLGIDILDAHAHLGILGTPPLRERTIAEQIRANLPRMDALGIRTLFASGQEALASEPVKGNLRLEAEAIAHGDRFRGYLAFNPHYSDALAARLDDFFSRPFFVGFKIHANSWSAPVTDPHYEPAWQYAQQHRLPVLLHTWQEIYDSPALLHDIARKYPEAMFLLGHSGGGDRGRREAEALALELPNVWLEWCGSFTSRIPWEETLPRVGRDRLVFGTDALFHGFAWELARFLSVDLPEADLRPALAANMQTILARRQ